MLKIAVILGTRPEITKMAPIIRELEIREADFFVLHTGQHYSYNLDGVFFEQLRLPQAKHNLEVGSSSHGEQTARILTAVEKVLQEESPDIVLVHGDTNSALAGALAAAKLNIKIGHVEAGLRSYDKSMPEEINRVLADHCSDYLFAPTEGAREILLGESIPEEKISVTGNTIVDSINQNLSMTGEQSNTLDSLHLKPGEYLLVTLHRQENVDNQARFASILDGLDKVAADLQLPLIYPVHPHSRKRLNEFKLGRKNLNLIEPVDFLGFLQLQSNARLILTDSGGIQEEACILGVPCVTLRDNTERPETVEVGANVLAGTSPDKILECARTMLGREKNWPNPFGDGKAGERIVRTITGGSDD
ncbi:MAG: UDP-N-acetylglucosamine 2-epimerase (non-hydrolyzing) [Dehalococcoidales bacterium]|nr:UDP-N-acetylglucosamine 2-epimerase (non-hydrolyzing) [Dehalococcoidales bacterium]MDP7524811.1 UDP-N-acetylglucosamine 2-epimerase (non-hydrolyzing) [Dehalococcoidales bacterium]